MSFFGFDAAPPNRGHHPAKAPGFAQATDHFAGLPTDDDDDDGLAPRQRCIFHHANLALEELTLKTPTTASATPSTRRTMPSTTRLSAVKMTRLVRSPPPECLRLQGLADLRIANHRQRL